MSPVPISTASAPPNSSVIIGSSTEAPLAALLRFPLLRRRQTTTTGSTRKRMCTTSSSFLSPPSSCHRLSPHLAAVSCGPLLFSSLSPTPSSSPPPSNRHTLPAPLGTRLFRALLSRVSAFLAPPTRLCPSHLASAASDRLDSGLTSKQHILALGRGNGTHYPRPAAPPLLVPAPLKTLAVFLPPQPPVERRGERRERRGGRRG